MKCFKNNSNKKASLLLIAFLVAVIATAFSLTTHAATKGLQATGYVSPKEGAILRSGTSTSTKKLTVLKYNTKVVVTGEVFVSKTDPKNTNKWYSVTVNNRKGYVRGELIKNIKYNSKKAKTTDELYYRVGPAKTMKRAGLTKKGASVEVVMEAKMQGSKDLWYKIKKGSKYYYSSAKWITFNKEPAKTTKPQSTSATTAKPQNTTTTTKPQNTTSTTPAPAKEVTVKNTVSGAVYPSKVGHGSPFVISGKVKSTVAISEGLVKIVNSSGKTVISAKKSLSGKTFDIASVDAKVRFGTLGIGSYKYVVQITVKGKKYTVLNKSFKVVKANRAEKIVNKALEIAWPYGTSSSKTSYSKGYATQAYKNALNKAYPDRSRWGAAPRAGASCDVFVGTVLRSSGVDLNAPRGLQEQFPHFRKSSKYKKIPFNGNRSVLRSGDIIMINFINRDGAHTCIYIKRNGKEYIAEAGYQRVYGQIISGTGGSANYYLSPNKSKSVEVFRIVE